MPLWSTPSMRKYCHQNAKKCQEPSYFTMEMVAMIKISTANGNHNKEQLKGRETQNAQLSPCKGSI